MPCQICTKKKQPNSEHYPLEKNRVLTFLPVTDALCPLKTYGKKTKKKEDQCPNP